MDQSCRLTPASHEERCRQFTNGQILDLGMAITFAWQRFIEAFGVAPDRWTDGAPPSVRAFGGNDHARS